MYCYRAKPETSLLVVFPLGEPHPLSSLMMLGKKIKLRMQHSNSFSFGFYTEKAILCNRFAFPAFISWPCHQVECLTFLNLHFTKFFQDFLIIKLSHLQFQTLRHLVCSAHGFGSLCGESVIESDAQWPWQLVHVHRLLSPCCGTWLSCLVV